MLFFVVSCVFSSKWAMGLRWVLVWFAFRAQCAGGAGRLSLDVARARRVVGRGLGMSTDDMVGSACIDEVYALAECVGGFDELMNSEEFGNLEDDLDDSMNADCEALEEDCIDELMRTTPGVMETTPVFSVENETDDEIDYTCLYEALVVASCDYSDRCDRPIDCTSAIFETEVDGLSEAIRICMPYYSPLDECLCRNGDCGVPFDDDDMVVFGLEEGLFGQVGCAEIQTDRWTQKQCDFVSYATDPSVDDGSDCVDEFQVYMNCFGPYMTNNETACNFTCDPDWWDDDALDAARRDRPAVALRVAAAAFAATLVVLRR